MKKQSYVAAVAAAAVIGTTGGTATALRTDGPAATGRAGSGAGASTASTAEAAPLWATPGAIHDGEKVVEVRGMNRISSVRRLPRGGYLATEAVSPGTEDPAQRVYRVSPKGRADLVTFVRGVGDVNADGTRFVGLALRSDRYVVREIATGRELAEVSVGPRRGSRPTGAAAYLDDRVATEWRAPKAKRSYVSAVTPSSDEPPLVLAEGLSEWNVSAEGGRIAGNQPNRDANADSNRCAVTGTLGQKKTIDCGHWFYGRQAAYSPDGSRVLAVPALTDGFGPGRFDVLNSWDGSVEAKVDLPDWAQEGAFLDEDTLMVKGATDGDGTGTVIYVCEVDGQCRETARSEADAVLGITG